MKTLQDTYREEEVLKASKGEGEVENLTFRCLGTLCEESKLYKLAFAFDGKVVSIPKVQNGNKRSEGNSLISRTVDVGRCWITTQHIPIF